MRQTLLKNSTGFGGAIGAHQVGKQEEGTVSEPGLPQLLFHLRRGGAL